MVDVLHVTQELTQMIIKDIVFPLSFPLQYHAIGTKFK